MTKFRKKPIVIDAEQWFPGNIIKGVVAAQDLPNDKIERICIDCGFDALFDLPNYGWIQTLEGGYIVQAGDWIITGVAGEVYPCKPDVFEATYELVVERIE